MSTVEFVHAYIHRLCRQLGANADAIYNAKTGAWYFSRGASTIEVFLTNVGDNEETGRIFFRCIAPIYTITTNPIRQFELYQKMLELNTRHMGIKLALIPDKQLICVISERDIEGMDYGEFITVITDISYWAGYFETSLKEQFGKP
ncbi:MAG: hypothetical protein EOO01_14065 [Chitinophagaceae bacterium]|nr:MAG: hypothetical protein EOO01_14065 [Chitinophagaceae bacterium]